MSKENNTIFNWQSWKAVAISILCVLILGLFLSWQYKRIEENSEEKLSSLEDVLTMGFVQEVVEDFMSFRIAGNENQAILFMTEEAFQQYEQGEYELIGEIDSYKIIEKSKLDQETYSFKVELYKKSLLGGVPEIIKVRTIGESYYIDSIEVAG